MLSLPIIPQQYGAEDGEPRREHTPGRAGVAVLVGVLVGGTAVFVGNGVLVEVLVGGKAVFVGNGVLVEVLVGGTAVFVGNGVLVEVLVGGTAVFVGNGVGGMLVGVADTGLLIV